MDLKSLVLLNFLTIAQSHLVQRIIGGREPKEHEFPNLVALVAIDDDDPLDIQGFCGGTILNENWVLSSGVCADSIHEIFDIEHVKVMTALQNLKEWRPSGQVVDIIQAIAHEKFERGKINAIYDIGLIRLAKSLRINEWVKPFPLSNLTDFISGKAIIAGWGWQGNINEALTCMTDVLQIADVDIIDAETCKKTLKKSMEKANLVFYEKYVHEKIICTSSASGKSGSQGDGGGPLMIKNKLDEYEVIGIMSFVVIPNGQPGSPTLNTKLPCYFGWIDETVRNNTLNIAATTSIAAN